LVPGQARLVRLSAEESGTFSLQRDPQVGWGHPPVAALVVIESEDEWNRAVGRLRDGDG
jgi:hypothetical protein